MADKVLPLIFLNLSGEMMYVIQQRLEAQKIPEDKSRKVIQDIITTMLNDQFIEELFKPQHMYSRSAMQVVFEKLVHSSIMRLNSSSMSKLYDLMLMVFKYQVVNCQDPEDILRVTLNHVDAIRYCAMPYPDLKKRTETIFSMIVATYKDLSHEDYENIYHCIVTFLQDLNIRVSVLMKLGLQLQNGEIIVFKNKDQLTENSEKITLKDKTYKANFGDTDTLQKTPCSYFELDGDRGTTLGNNIYVQTTLKQCSNIQNSSLVVNATKYSEDDPSQTAEEVTLLGRLIGKLGTHDFVPEIILSTNDEDDLCQGNSTKENCSLLKIDAIQVQNAELGQISNDFLIDVRKNEKCDILELLDAVGKEEM